LVVASIALTRSASATEKRSAMPSSSAIASAENAGTSAIAGSAASAFSHSISTMTRYLISAYSLKKSRSGAVLLP
jgi:hypothetical protein